jgi:hypothetical protein
MTPEQKFRDPVHALLATQYLPHQIRTSNRDPRTPVPSPHQDSPRIHGTYPYLHVEIIKTQVERRTPPHQCFFPSPSSLHPPQFYFILFPFISFCSLKLAFWDRVPNKHVGGGGEEEKWHSAYVRGLTRVKRLPSLVSKNHQFRLWLVNAKPESGLVFGTGIRTGF